MGLCRSLHLQFKGSEKKIDPARSRAARCMGPRGGNAAERREVSRRRLSPVMLEAQRVHERSAQPRAARRCAGENQAPHPRYIRRHDFRVPSFLRARRAEICQPVWRRRISTVVGSNILCGPIEAALVTAFSLIPTRPTIPHGRGTHPGCTSFPPRWQSGEQFGISGQAFHARSRSGLRRWDARVIRLSARGPHQSKSTHAWWDLRRRAAAGCAASLNAQQMRWLLDYAAQQSAGIAAWQRDTDHIEKGFVFGGSRRATESRPLCWFISGWTGVDDILSGDDNFLLAYASKADPAADRQARRALRNDADQHQEMDRRMPIQAPLDALETC